jgi:tetratricopeptide (TPR) repeat protein
VDVSVSLSFDTLSADSRRILHALSLHPAGASTELLGEILPGDVALVPNTAELVRKSLVEKTGAHLRVLAPIREFVRARAADESAGPLLLAAIEAHRRHLQERLSNAYRLEGSSEWDRLAQNLGAYDDAAEHYRIGLRLHEQLGENPLARGDALECLADLARVTGDWDRAITRYTEARRAFDSVPDGWVGLTNTAHSLGETRLALHDVDGARMDYDQALRISQRIGDAQGQANALLGLAKTDLMQADFSSAQGRTQDAAEIYHQIDDGLGAANALMTVGDLAVARGQFTDADTAYADAEAAFTTLSCPLNRILVSLRRLIARQLGWDSPHLMRAWAEFEELTGRSISVKESRRWPPEKKGSVFHGCLEVTG